MGKHTIRSEEEFWAYIQLGVPLFVYAPEGGEPVYAEGCIEARDKPDKEWMQSFRNRWIPRGEYYVEVE